MKFLHSDKIKKIRLEKKYSQEYVAFELGISQKSYSDLENGKTSLKEEYLKKLCGLYNVKPHFFCNLSCECSANAKLDKILKYLQENNVPIPKELLS